MKNFLAYKCIFLILAGNIITVASKSAGKADTTFLVNTKNQKVYIDHNKESSRYDDVRSFDNTACLDLTRKGAIGKWCSLYLYKNKFYAYRPCDGMYNERCEITEKKLLLMLPKQLKNQSFLLHPEIINNIRFF